MNPFVQSSDIQYDADALRQQAERNGYIFLKDKGCPISLATSCGCRPTSAASALRIWPELDDQRVSESALQLCSWVGQHSVQPDTLPEDKLTS